MVVPVACTVAVACTVPSQITVAVPPLVPLTTVIITGVLGVTVPPSGTKDIETGLATGELVVAPPPPPPHPHKQLDISTIPTYPLEYSFFTATPSDFVMPKRREGNSHLIRIPQRSLPKLWHQGTLLHEDHCRMQYAVRQRIGSFNNER